MITRQFELLVLDTVAFLQNVAVQNLASEAYTVPQVIAEIKDRATRERLQALPYPLKVRTSDPKYISRVHEFARQTGDYSELSATDIHLLALTLQLYTEHNADNTPHVQPSSESGVSTLLAGMSLSSDQQSSSDGEEQSSTGGEEQSSTEDDEGWITMENFPKNIDNSSIQTPPTREHSIKVACMTSDFCMQNVLKKMSLEIVSTQGRLIRQLRSHAYRCFGCYHLTYKDHDRFCPECGQRTLKRVSISTSTDGRQQVHVSDNRPISQRGVRFSIPLNRGGKKSVLPPLCADQPRPQLHVTKRAKSRNAILSEDYVQGMSPFALRDITSRSAVQGLNNRKKIQSWQRRNPNATVPCTGNRKKRR